MKTGIAKAIAAVSLIAVTGCTTTDYQVGDGTKKLLEARDTYCSATTPEGREQAKAYLASKGIDTGEQSICDMALIDLVALVVE